MELNYIKEHTSCVNYKTEEYSGFSLGQAWQEKISTIRSRR